MMNVMKRLVGTKETSMCVDNDDIIVTIIIIYIYSCDLIIARLTSRINQMDQQVIINY